MNQLTQYSGNQWSTSYVKLDEAVVIPAKSAVMLKLELQDKLMDYHKLTGCKTCYLKVWCLWAKK